MRINTAPILRQQYNLTILSQIALRKHNSYLCYLLITTLFFLSMGIPAFAQGTPRLNSLFPAGGQLGTTVEITVQGSDLEGAHTLIIEGDPGITAQLHPGGGEIDDTHKPVFEANCGQCHELRSPNNRSMTPAQWQATVQRMVTEKGAEISPEAQTQIIAYLASAARANAGLTAKLSIAPDAPIGLREVRIVGKHGTSTAWPFEVSHIQDVVETESNNVPESATTIELPSLVNGVINPGGDEDYYVFEGNQGQRCVFSVKAYRLNNVSQQFFNPTISLFDAKGVEIARSNGFYSLDPLLDVTLPTNGQYLLRIRDLLYRGNPDAIYRLTSGVLPYNTYLFPPGGTVPSKEPRPEEKAGTFHGPPTPPEPNFIQCVIGGENLPETNWQVELTANENPDLKQISTPYGIFPFIANAHLQAVEENTAGQSAQESGLYGKTPQNPDLSDPTPRKIKETESEILFQTKCSTCHELRSPSNRVLSAEEWEQTITRMANKENADITPTERDRIIAFVAQEAQRLGEPHRTPT